MKKIYSTFILLFFFSVICNNSFAQCTPQPNNTTLITPDTITNFVSGTVGIPYTQDAFVHVPPDTVISIVTFYIDSILLNNVSGLPPGLSYASNPANNHYMSNTSGCINISGTPTTAGYYPLTLDIRAYGYILFLGSPIPIDTPFTVQAYHIDVLPTGITQVNQNFNFEITDISPAADNSTMTAHFNSPQTASVECTVHNILGNMVSQKSMAVKKGINSYSINTKNLSAGVYFFSVKNGNTKLARRFVVSK